MDREKKIIFLSAGVPFLKSGRNPKYYDSADIIAIRDAIRALAYVAIPDYKIVFGGQPYITALLEHIMNKSSSENFILYQSAYFRTEFIDAVDSFSNLRITDNIDDNMQRSLEEMRFRMLSEHTYYAAFFIGGMDGIEDEFLKFTDMHPTTPVYPLASTGGGSMFVYEKCEQEFGFSKRLKNDYAYVSLFKELLDNTYKLND